MMNANRAATSHEYSRARFTICQIRHLSFVYTGQFRSDVLGIASCYSVAEENDVSDEVLKY